MSSLLQAGQYSLHGFPDPLIFHTTPANTSPSAQGQDGQDYGDKGINAAEQKFGFDKDHKYDKYEEKGSDALREQIEKKSGKNIPAKVR